MLIRFMLIVLCHIEIELRKSEIKFYAKYISLWLIIIIPITNCIYCRTMAKKNNGGFPLQSTGSKPGFSRNDSTESIVSFGNTKSGCTAQSIFVSAMDTINHILIVLVTLYLVYHAAKKYSVTNVHVILCTIGVSILHSWNTHLISVLLPCLV